MPFNEDEAAGFHQLTDFFSAKKPTKKRGRPPKNKGRGRPKNASPPTPPLHMRKSPPENYAACAVAGKEDGGDEDDDAAEEDLTEEEEEEEDGPKRKKSRINWGVEPNRSKMEKAINDWFKKEGDAVDANGENVELRNYAVLVEIPYQSLYKYVHPDEEKRKVLGNGDRGRKRLLQSDDVKFLGEMFCRLDRCNDGASLKEAADLVMDAKPNLSRQQARLQVRRRVIPESHAAGVLKKKPQKVQASTSERTAINLPQQWRWHVVVEEQYKFLRETNIGICKKSGKTFGEVMAHFIIGLDEMCIMSDAHGNLKVIGAFDRQKHEKGGLQDTRCSITIVRTGTCAGTTGPTIFLLKGTTKRAAYTDAFLEKHGLAKGSTIIMTENAYMTDEAWLQVSQAIVKGYRNLPYVKDNPDWYMLELLDGFKSHENVLAANELRAKHKINSLKEESNTSHVCQGYDQQVARADKKNTAECLYDQRKMKQQQTAKANISQWDLIMTGIRIVKQCEKDNWVSSYTRVNRNCGRINFNFWE